MIPDNMNDFLRKSFFIGKMISNDIDTTFEEIQKKITDKKLAVQKQINIITERIHELDCIMQDINEGFDNLLIDDYEDYKKEKSNLELTLEKYKERYPEYFI